MNTFETSASGKIKPSLSKTLTIWISSNSSYFSNVIHNHEFIQLTIFTRIQTECTFSERADKEKGQCHSGLG